MRNRREVLTNNHQRFRGEPMSENLSPQEIISIFIMSHEIMKKAMDEGNYRKNNKEAKKLSKFIAPLKEDLELARYVYGELLKADFVSVRSHAAIECLRMGIHTHESEQILKELSKRNDIGVTRTACEMALRLWRGEIPGKTL